jgi:60 kDa SS-A/Ro ribonucleoprotein
MNRNLFTPATPVAPTANTRNEAGGEAYKRSDYENLCQYVCTGTLYNTFYVKEKDHLNKTLALAKGVSPEQVAKAAVFGRKEGFMKDIPAFLTAYLASPHVYGRDLLDRVFPVVIDNQRMLRNFVKVIRSGVVGRQSLGSQPKRLIREWLASRPDEVVFRSTIGKDPSMVDIIKLVHPKPRVRSREALYGWLLDKPYQRRYLPTLVKQFEAFRDGKTNEVPQVPFEMLTALPLTREAWTEIAAQATWQQTRMNLNTFNRHGVFDNAGLVTYLAHKLANPELIARAKVFPYQLLTTYVATQGTLPVEIQSALHAAVEHSTMNVPEVPGKVYIAVDVSGSMHWPVTGEQGYGRVSTKASCLDAASLFAAAILRRNPHAEVLAFNNSLYTQRNSRLNLDPNDTILTNAQKLRSLPQGGTNCSLPLTHLNEKGARGDLVVYVSDNESWIDSAGSRGYWYSGFGYSGNSGTAMHSEWLKFKRRNKGAKLVCIDITADTTGQVKGGERPDILEVGGFSDMVFKVVANFVAGGTSHWSKLVDAVEL